VLAEKAHFEVRRMCRVLGIAPSWYYDWERKQQSERARQEADLLASIRRIFAQFRGRYGAPRVHDQLIREGVRVSRKRVARLMREAGLRAKGRRKYKATTDSSHALPVAPNLLERDFHAARPDAVWVSDITYVWTRQGWMYLAQPASSSRRVPTCCSPFGSSVQLAMSGNPKRFGRRRFSSTLRFGRMHTYFRTT
jgi:putative transposase